MIKFFVPGIPKPAGSKRGFYNAKAKRVIITDACATSKDWKADVKAFALKWRPDALLDGPIRLSVHFFMPRPKNHYRTDGQLKPLAPYWHTNKPDATKLMRGVEDALTGVIWRDDAQVVEQEGWKFYGDQPGAKIEVQQLSGASREADKEGTD